MWYTAHFGYENLIKNVVNKLSFIKSLNLLEIRQDSHYGRGRHAQFCCYVWENLAATDILLFKQYTEN